MSGRELGVTMAIHPKSCLFGAEGTLPAKHLHKTVPTPPRAGSTWSSGVEQLHPELEPCQTRPYFFNLGNGLYRSHYKINVHATHSRLFHSQIVFSRPIRWILALHGDFVVPFYFAGISRYYILY